MGTIIGIIIVLWIIGFFIVAAWNSLVAEPAKDRQQKAAHEARQKAAADYYATVEAMTVEEHRAELANAEAELKADVIRHADKYQTGSDATAVLRSIENSYGRLDFEQWDVNKYQLHLRCIIQHESQCSEQVAHSAAWAVINKKVTDWATVVLNRKEAECEKQHAEYYLQKQKADVIASKYLTN